MILKFEIFVNIIMSECIMTEIENIEDRMIHVVLIIPKTYSFRI